MNSKTMVGSLIILSGALVSSCVAKTSHGSRSQNITQEPGTVRTHESKIDKPRRKAGRIPDDGPRIVDSTKPKAMNGAGEQIPRAKQAASAAALRPTTRGYSAAAMYVHPWSSRCRVSVNGLLVGVYDKKTWVPIGSFLEAGKVNEITYEFTPVKKGGAVGSATIQVQLPGHKEWLKVLESSGRATETFEVPIVAKANGD